MPKDADEAFKFLTSVHVNVEEVLAVNLARLRRRVDLRLVPFLWLCYSMCWLDKAILNVGRKASSALGIDTDRIVVCQYHGPAEESQDERKSVQRCKHLLLRRNHLGRTTHRYVSLMNIPSFRSLTDNW